MCGLNPYAIPGVYKRKPENIPHLDLIMQVCKICGVDSEFVMIRNGNNRHSKKSEFVVARKIIFYLISKSKEFNNDHDRSKATGLSRCLISSYRNSFIDSLKYDSYLKEAYLKVVDGLM